MHSSNFTLTFAFRREPFVRKCAFDVGDYGLGYCTFPLSLGCDCLGHIKCGRVALDGDRQSCCSFTNAAAGPAPLSEHQTACMHAAIKLLSPPTLLPFGCLPCVCRYFDATLSNSKGEPVTIDKAICMHEEDHGLLYKHVDYRTGHSESRRMRRLVISHISTVVNYEYCFYWYLYQDGTISLDIKLTGAPGCLPARVAAASNRPFAARPFHAMVMVE